MRILIELIGGPSDGRMVSVLDEYLHRPLELAVPPTMAEIRAPSLTGWPEPQRLTYEWDGTVREDGVRRFRLR